jgi:hypothetical protein
MRRIASTVITFTAVCLLLYGCSSRLTVNYLTSNGALVYPATDKVLTFRGNPDNEFKVIGLITAESMEYGEEKLLEELEKKAMEIGAHGIIIKPAPPSGESPPPSGNRIEAYAIRFINKKPRDL